MKVSRLCRASICCRSARTGAETEKKEWARNSSSHPTTFRSSGDAVGWVEQAWRPTLPDRPTLRLGPGGNGSRGSRGLSTFQTGELLAAILKALLQFFQRIFDLLVKNLLARFPLQFG